MRLLGSLKLEASTKIDLSWGTEAHEFSGGASELEAMFSAILFKGTIFDTEYKLILLFYKAQMTGAFVTFRSI